LDSKIMEIRLKQWIPIFEEQAKSGLNKQDWCSQNEVKRTTFFKWQRVFRNYLLEKNQDKLRDQSTNELAVHKAPDFVELASAGTPGTSALNNSCVRSDNITPASSIIIKCGEFSINVNDDVNELLLSKVLKVMSNVY